MNIRGAGLMIFSFTVLFVMALFCGHFQIGMSGGVTAQTALPTGTWSFITGAIDWFGNTLTFSLTTDYGILSIILWFFIVMFFLGLVLAIRGD